MADLAAELRQIGRDAGLDAVGICDAQPFTDARRALEHHRQLGWAADMQFTYRNPDRSTDPARTVPGAASLIVGARGYLRRDPEPTVTSAAGARARPTARVARYSWVDHYGPLRAALRVIGDRLTADGWQARVLADDNALVDRAAAVRAGLGWTGKNTNVLLPGAGSWFVLGSVVTDAPLAAATDPPEPVADGCGGCRRCLAACPTGALVGPAQLDARRCLAWLVQAPGVFPAEYREALGDRIYGCDDCQDVCPVNRLGRTDPPSAEAGAQPAVDVLDLLAATDDEILAAVGRWYIPGREPRYVRRNALIVLGNTADPSDPAVVAALVHALTDGDPIVRAHAVWAAARLGRRDLLPGGADVDPIVTAELQDAGAVP